MTVFNFPDTAGKPTDGSFVWTAPNGTLYSWDGEAWRTTGSGGGGGGGDANITVTDDLTNIVDPSQGDLAYHTEEARMYIYYEDLDSKQWVDASPGGDSIDSGGGGSSQYWDRLGTTLTPKTSGDDVDLGSGDFTTNGNVDIGSSNISGDHMGTTIDSNGQITLQKNSGHTDEDILRGFGSSTQTVSIRADGTASFANVVSTQGHFFSEPLNPHSGMNIYGTFTNEPTAILIKPSSGAAQQSITLNFDGSSTFANTLTINDPANSSGHSFGPGGGAEHTVAAGTVDTTPVLSVIKGFGNPTFQVTANGDVKTGTFNSASNGVAGIELGVLGACSVQRVNGTADGANIFIGYRGNDAQFFVTANGVISARNTAISQIGSERRLKNNIEPLDAVTSWNTIRDLPYYSYKLNGNGESTYYGPIVDECPEEMIVEGATSDEQGNIRTYDNSLLQGRLFIALQTALTRIEQLEQTNASLEERLTTLEGGNN